MLNSKSSEIEIELGKALLKNQDILLAHLWPSEHDRWVELVFALIAEGCDLDEAVLRETVEEFDELNLLDLEEIAKLPVEINSLINESPVTKTIIGQFSDLGLSNEQGVKVLVTIIEAAKGFVKNFDGKVQKYLRLHGERMIEELSQTFSFSNLPSAKVSNAFVYWLQNVTNMPLSLVNDETTKFCGKFGITQEKLIQYADKLNLNVALLDDLISEYMKNEPKESER